MTISAPMNRGFGSNAVNNADYANEGIPVVLITTIEDGDDDGNDDEWSEILPLPASRYRYTKWHEIENVTVASSMLRAPRVRQAPKGYKKDTIDAIEEEEMEENSDIDIESGLGTSQKSKNKRKKKKKRQDYRNKLEDWQTCLCVNLSYQELGHGYQLKEFYKVLRKLVRCIEIELIDDSLADLHMISFPSCTRLNLQRNFLSSFKKLPRIPNIEHLALQQNNISSLNGLEIFRRTRLKSMVLDGNPVSLEKNYRQKVFQILPDLRMLDGLPKLPSDEQISNDDESKSGSCTVS
eukprot:Seg962.1 transcript_id=Seg962.1/GoldUCD/mRNA.D3Y31 product="Acidic leucine-rich nuclear phosphoprotein 32-related protein" protein_id=Seg962.1/GoldUCD/D3Y31